MVRVPASLDDLIAGCEHIASTARVVLERVDDSA
jgi:hypothetical protein